MQSELLRIITKTGKALNDEDKRSLRDALDTHLEDVAFLLELNGENPHRIRAYRKAKRALYANEQGLAEMIRNSTLQCVEGIGKSIENELMAFCNHGGMSPYLESLQVQVPPVLLSLGANQGLRRILPKIYRNYAFQELGELIPLLDSNIIGTLISISRSDWNLLNDSLQREATEAGSQPPPLPNILRGGAPHVQDISAAFLEEDELLLSSLDFLVSPRGGLPDAQEQINIHYQFELSRPRSASAFYQEALSSTNPLVDLFRFPGLFQRDLELDSSFLKDCEARKKSFVVPLHPILSNRVLDLLGRLNSYHIGLLFSAWTPGLKKSLQDELAYLLKRIDLEPGKILNFQPGEALLTYLLRE